MAVERRHPGGLQTRDSAAEDGHRRAVPADAGAFDGHGSVFGLVSGRRIDDAGHDRVAVVADLAGLVAQHAGSDPLRLPGPDLGHQVGVGQLRPGHLDRVGHAVGHGALGHLDVDDRALRSHHHAVPGHRPHRVTDRAGQLQVEPRRGVAVGAGGARGEDRAAHDGEQVDDRGAGVVEHECGGELGGHLGGDAGPGGELVAAQPEPDDPVGTDRVAHRGQHPAGEQRPVLAPLVAAGVGQPRQELAHQGELAGVDLDAVAARNDRPPRRVGEPVDDRRDVVGLHLLGDLTGVHLGDPTRRPQLALGPVRGALAPGVAEPGQHDRPVGSARLDHRRPAGAALERERSALERPVRRVHRGVLGDDHAGAAAGPTPVVGDVALRERPTASEVGLVGAEHDAARRGPGADRQRVEQGRHRPPWCPTGAAGAEPTPAPATYRGAQRHTLSQSAPQKPAAAAAGGDQLIRRGRGAWAST